MLGPVYMFYCLIKSASLVPVTQHPLSAERLYGVSKFWQEVNYNFVFLDKVNRHQWDSLYKETLLRCQETASDYSITCCCKAVRQLKDGHTNVYFPNEVAKNLYTTNFGAYRFCELF